MTSILKCKFLTPPHWILKNSSKLKKFTMKGGQIQEVKSTKYLVLVFTLKYHQEAPLPH